MLAAALSALHILGLAFALLCGYERERALAAPFDRSKVPAVLRWDNLALAAVIVWIGAGLGRLFGGVEKPAAWYAHNPMFHAKMGLFALAWCLELWPMITFIRWRGQLARGEEPDIRHVPRFVWLFRVEMGLMIFGVLVASMMARGVGYAPRAAGYCAVREVVAVQCASCHSPSTRLGGLDLVTDARAALVDAPSAQWPDRLRVKPGDPAGSLLHHKLAGTQGEHGQPMPVGRPSDPRTVEVVDAWIRAGATTRCE